MIGFAAITVAAMPLGRRAFSAAALSATLAGVPSPLPAATLAPPSLAQRLATPRFSRLELLKPDLTTSRPDTLHYPSWMLGTWRVENAVVAFSMPLGSAFVDDFVQQSARADVRKAEELSYQLRWVRAPAPAGDGALVAVQDRGFNALQETRAFLGEDGTCEAAAFAMSASAPHGELRLGFRDEEAALSNPLKPPPRLIEQLVIEWCQWQRLGVPGGAGEGFVTSELIRQQLLGEGEPPMQVESIVRCISPRSPLDLP